MALFQWHVRIFQFTAQFAYLVVLDRNLIGTHDTLWHAI